MKKLYCVFCKHLLHKKMEDLVRITHVSCFEAYVSTVAVGYGIL